ncbi:hypothetical protein OS493_006647, partial [Desmophyllum pertusum]
RTPNVTPWCDSRKDAQVKETVRLEKQKIVRNQDAQVKETVRLEKQKIVRNQDARVEETVRLENRKLYETQDAQVEETVRLEKQKLYEPGRPSRRNRTIRETEIVRTRTPKSKKPYD